MEDREYGYDDSDSDNEKYTPPNNLEISNVTSLNLLPQKSRKKYEAVYKSFVDWRSFKNVNSVSENVLLDYFSELANKYKPTSLWANYSMLKSTLNLYENIDIERFAKLRSFLKHKSEGYTGKQAKTLTPEEIKRFIIGAPDKIYLATKVALIMGLAGACQANELYHMNLDDFEDLGSAVVVNVPKAKPRTFTITGSFYSIYKKYANLNPNNKLTSSFFLNYQNGKCTPQKIGINKFGAMGKQVAKYLKLPHPELYTGHCFRKSSATMLAGTGGDSAVRYIDDSIRANMNSPKKINQTIENIEIKPPSTGTSTSSSTNSSTFTQKTSITKTINLDSMPKFNFSNCSNFTININVTKPDT